MTLPSRFCLALLACLWLAASNEKCVAAAEHVVDPISFLGTSNKKRSLQATRFRSNCLYDIVVYMNIRGGSVNSYNQLLFSGPTTPGGVLTLGNGQVAEGGSPTSFDLLDGGHTAGVRIEWNTQTCGSQTVDLTAAIDSFQYGPENRIVCGGGLFTVFLKMRAFLQNPECLLEEPDQNLKATKVMIDPVATAEEEACIFQVSKYADYTFENYAHLKSMAGNFEFTASPQTDCSADGSECDTFQLYQYDGDKYLATLASTHTTSCVSNHETMAPVVTDRASPWESVASGSFEDGSFRTSNLCDGTEGFVDSNVGAAYSWWMTVHVLNPETCTSLKSPVVVSSAQEAAPGAQANSTGGDSTRKLLTSWPSRSNNITLVDLDSFISLATDSNNKSSCGTPTTTTGTREQQPTTKSSGNSNTQGQVFGFVLMMWGLSWMFV